MRSWIIAVALFVVLVSAGFAADYDAGVSAFDRRDYSVALREFRPLAREGHAEAQFKLGVMYDNGYGVAEDDREAFAWYRKAAEQDLAEAQFNLGIMYYYGLGVVADSSEAAHWYVSG